MTFHDHLEQCSRCANEPFNLCEVGAGLLVQEAHALLGGQRSVFETHLSKCHHCMLHPHDLCQEGEELWQKDVDEYRKHHP